MKEEHITKLKNVWESKNKILKPIEKKLVIDIIDQVASLFSAGNYYYFVTNFETYKMDFVSDGILNVLGIYPNEFSLEKLFELLMPEDLEKLHEKEAASMNFKLNKIPREDITKYKTVYLLRLKDKNGIFKTILHQAKVINITENGKLLQVLSIYISLIL